MTTMIGWSSHRIAPTLVALGLLGLAAPARAALITSLVGDKDGFGIPGAEAVPADLTTFTGIGGTLGTDYRDAGDLASAPFTDRYAFYSEAAPPPPVVYTHDYTLGGTPIAAFLYVQQSGMADSRGPWDVLFNGVLLGQIGVFPGMNTDIRLVGFLVPAALLTGSDTVRLEYLTPETDEGYAINYSELVVETRSVPEPTTMVLLGSGLVLVARRRFKGPAPRA